MLLLFYLCAVALAQDPAAAGDSISIPMPDSWAEWAAIGTGIGASFGGLLLKLIPVLKDAGWIGWKKLLTREITGLREDLITMQAENAGMLKLVEFLTDQKKRAREPRAVQEEAHVQTDHAG